MLEPTGLCRSNGKRLDWVTIFPWKTDHTLVCDVACVDTFTASHLPQATREARAVVALAEQRKRAKYLDLARMHHFVETTGAMGAEALEFFSDISRRIRAVTHEEQHVCVVQQVLVALR